VFDINILLPEWILPYSYTLLLIPLLSSWGVFWWNSKFAFPLFLTRQLKRNKKWLYIPLFWNLKKKMIKKNHFLIKLMSFILWCVFTPLGLSFYLSGQFGLVFGFTLAVLIECLSRYVWLRKRYKQQEQIFFFELANASNEAMISGERTPETELRNRITWEHQQVLRLADERGEFFKVLEKRFREAKI
jgi:hypothetical protein